ncbi:hypothetical protein HQ563_16635 [bacterium]|nr:hypothetical protein [bacterium]
MKEKNSEILRKYKKNIERRVILHSRAEMNSPQSRTELRKRQYSPRTKRDGQILMAKEALH